MRLNVKLCFVLVAAASVFSFDTAHAAEVTVLAVAATKEVIVELVPQFEKSSGHKAAITWTGSANIKKRIASGEVYDLVIVDGPLIDAFSKEGSVATGSRTDLMKSGVGAAVRAGAAKFDISSSEGLKRTLLAAKSIGYSSGSSGTYMMGLIERMGIADQIKSKMKQVPSGMRISTMIESGEVDIGFQQISELIHEKGVDYLGPLPPDIQKITIYSVGLHSGAKEPVAAKELVKALTGPAGVAVIKQHGMEPI